MTRTIWTPLVAGVMLIAPVVNGFRDYYTDTWRMIVALAASAIALAVLLLGSLRDGGDLRRILYICCAVATVENALGLIYMRFWSPSTDIGGAGLSLLAQYLVTAACGALVATAAFTATRQVRATRASRV